jgi:hypothetical protein
LAVVAVSATVAAAPWASATAAGTALNDAKFKVPSFGEFIASVRAAGHPPSGAAAQGQAVQEGALGELRAHILKSYQRVDSRQVKHSFVDENDSVFDCIPIRQQLALRDATEAVAKPPSPPWRAGRAFPRNDRLRPALGMVPDRKDRHGNATSCTAGTVPVRRLTLDDLSRFKTLGNFFRKWPEGVEVLRGGDVPRAAPSDGHLYAHARQYVRNLGGSSLLALWAPQVATDQIEFSLSQQWYAAVSDGNTQTVEVGWQVFPAFYGHTAPVLFIFWTADAYQSQMCYNLTCGAFVQIDPSVAIGGAFSSWTTSGYEPVEFQAGFLLYSGNWWLQVNGVWVGYYPGTLFGAGLLATGAESIDYGGETLVSARGVAPPMGSGMFAEAGYPYAAHQRDIFYYPPMGGLAQPVLTLEVPTPWYYSAFLMSYDAPWGTTIYFGGPGGTLQQ